MTADPDAPTTAPPSAPGDVAEDVAKVARGSTMVLLGWAFDQVFRLGLVVLLTRSLGADGYGTFIAAMALLYVVMAFSPLGLGSGLLLKVSEWNGREPDPDLAQEMRIGTGVSLLVGILLATVVATAAAFAPELFGAPEVATAVLWMSPILAVHGFTIAVHGALIGGNYVRSAGLGLDIIRPGTHVLLAAAAIGLAYDLPGVLIASVASYLIGAAALLGLVLTRKPSLVFAPGSPTRSLVQASMGLLAVSVPLTLAETLHRLNLSLDVLMLNWLTDDLGALGIYRVAVALALMAGLPVAAGIVMFKPLVGSLLAANEVDRLGQAARVVGRWMIVGITPVYVGMIGLPELALLPFGAEFSPASHPMSVLLAGQGVQAALALTTPLLAFSKARWLHVGAGAVALVVNGVLDVALIPEFGSSGAAIASAIAIAVWAILRAIATYKVVGVVSQGTQGWLLFGVAAMLGIASYIAANSLSIGWRIPALGGGLLVFAALAWAWCRTPLDREIGRVVFKRFLPKPTDS